MKCLSVILSIVVGVIFLAGCGEEKSACERLKDGMVVTSGEITKFYEDFCSARVDVCCLCDCINGGMDMNFGSTADDCTCTPHDGEGEDELVDLTEFFLKDDPRCHAFFAEHPECEDDPLDCGFTAKEIVESFATTFCEDTEY